ncbi:Integrase, catalytic core [Gossypium australe]|uniref:Integrase, catalytic core n=1 Tax=Gossypium australe TaxID=47621 RepID=A0A5B6WRS4_9ROSI|nr:Integrase, catalytic core [Gossypium australe]
MRVNDQQITFNVFDAMKCVNTDEKFHAIEIIDTTIQEKIEDFCSNNSKNDVDVCELIDADMIIDLDKLMEVQQIGNRSRRSFESLNMSDHSFKPPQPSIEDTHAGIEAFASTLEVRKVSRKSKKALGWSIADIKGTSPTICMHKIILEDCHGKSIEQQRRLNPFMKEVVKMECNTPYPYSTLEQDMRHYRT